MYPHYSTAKTADSEMDNLTSSKQYRHKGVGLASDTVIVSHASKEWILKNKNYNSK